MTKDASGTHVWLVVMKAYRALLRHADKSVASLDLCLSDFVVLEMLLHKGPQQVNAIGRKAALTSGSITTAIDRLEKRKLVARTVSGEDRRARVVQLTPKGQKLIQEAFGIHAGQMETASQGLNLGERKILVSLLKKLGKNAQSQLEEDEDKEDEEQYKKEKKEKDND